MKDFLNRLKCSIFGHKWKHHGTLYVAIPSFNKRKCECCQRVAQGQDFFSWIGE